MTEKARNLIIGAKDQSDEEGTHRERAAMRAPLDRWVALCTHTRYFGETNVRERNNADAVSSSCICIVMITQAVSLYGRENKVCLWQGDSLSRASLRAVSIYFSGGFSDVF